MNHIIAGGVQLIDLTQDVSDLMGLRRPTLRDRRDIVRLYVHHSGATGRKGREGALNSTKYVLRMRGWGMPAYHYWIPREPDGDSVEIYQLAPIAWRCYHTGKAANTHGIGLACQGNTTLKPMTDHQEEALEAMVPWIEENVLRPCPPGEDWLSWHAEAGKYGGKAKAACPGVRLQRWLQEYRDMIGYFDDV